MLESRRLRHFLAVYELGSIGRAAERLLLTQPALSKSLRQLEEELGCKLFDRTPIGVAPTVFAEALFGHAKSIEAAFRAAEAQIAGLRGKAKGIVNIGMGPSVAAHLLPQATIALAALHPGVALAATEGLVDDLLPMLRRGQVSLIAGSWPRIADAEFTSETIVKDEIRVFARAGHPLDGRRVALADLAAFPWALPPATQRWRQQLDAIFAGAGLEPVRPAVSSNSASYLQAVLTRGDHLSFLPARLAADARLAALDVEMAALPADVTMTFRERALLSAPVGALVQVLRALGKELGEED